MATAVEPSSPGDPITPNTPRENDLPLPPAPRHDGPSEDTGSASWEGVQHVLASDIGITTLLSRLKQSISSTRDFAAFLKERAILEEKHAQGLKRLSRSTADIIGRPESRQGSFAHNYREITKIHDDMANHGLQFSSTLLVMSEELHELATNSERGRKHWKQSGLNAEKRVQDAELAADKAKAKYNALAEQYDRARTGEKQTGKFGLKGPKSAAQHEEDLHRKLEASDGDYAAKVQAAQSQQQDLLSTYRPQTINALQELIKETDAGLSVHVQKFAALSEKLLLGYGLCITPLKGQSPMASQSSKSLREVALSINNDRDFVDFVLSFTHKAGNRANEIKYEKHPLLSPKQQQQSQPPPSFSSAPSDPYAQTYGPNQGRQVSGVTSYQGEGYQAPGPQNQYPVPQGSAPNYGQSRPQQPPQPMGYGGPSQGPDQPHSEAPQLPQLDSFGGDRFSGQTSGVVSPGGNQSGPSNQFNPGPGQPPASGPDNVRSPVSSIGSQNQLGQQYGQIPGRPDFKPPGPLTMNSPDQSSQQAPGPQSPTEQPGFHPPRGASLGQSGDFTSGNGPPNGPPGQVGPPPRPPMGRDQSQGAPSAELRPTGIGPTFGPQGSQQGMPPQGSGPRIAGPGPVQAPGQAPPNGALRPTQGGGLASLPSRQRTGPPVKPVFGVSLDELFQRDGTAVPIIVVQCVQAVDFYGLDVEGIYRTSGSAHHIMELRQQFDHDSTSVDFRNAAAFHNDIASVTTLLKHFLRDLPDPLLTAAQYKDFVQAAKLDEEIVRRDSIHALVNALPDPNYATLRLLALHLHRVAQHSDRNKMTKSNLAIVFAPTLMGQQGGANGHLGGGGADIADAGWQAKVVETILNNTFQIFDDDE